MLRHARSSASCTVQSRAPRATLALRPVSARASAAASLPASSSAPRCFYGGGHHDHKPVRKPGVRYFTRTEVAEHSFVDDAWIVIHGHVYNITAWVPQHPGGNVILADATDLFERIGHSDYAQSRLKDYYIGEVEGDKRHDNVGDGLPWYYQTHTGLDAHRDKHPRPFDFRLPDDEPAGEDNILMGARLSTSPDSRGVGKKV